MQTAVILIPCVVTAVFSIASLVSMAKGGAGPVETIFKLFRGEIDSRFG